MAIDTDHAREARPTSLLSRLTAWDVAASRRIGIGWPHPRWFTIPLSAVSLSANYGLLWFALAAIPWLAGVPRGGVRFLYSAGAVLAAEMLTYGVKVLVGRRRPAELEQGMPNYIALPRSRSFPSSHASMGVLGVASMASLYPAWLAPLIALLAVLVFSRVYLRVHYLLDVLAGLLFGLVLMGLLLALVPVPR